MSEISKNKVIKPGKWRTIESGWNVTFKVVIAQAPAGTRLKVRYGDGWGLGKDSQKQKSNGFDPMSVDVGGGSIAYARVQVKTDKEITLFWSYIPIGP